MEKDLPLKSANPYCPITHKINGIPDDGINIYSTNNGILIGWCLFMKRDIFSIIGDLDENIEFWYSDNDYGNTLKKHHIKHALITNSKVTHLGSQSHDLLTEKEKFNFSYGQFLYFDYKWNHQSKMLFGIKKKILPIFQYFFFNKNSNVVYSLITRLLAKMFGGLK